MAGNYAETECVMPRKNKYEWQRIGQELMEETRKKNEQSLIEEPKPVTTAAPPKLPIKCVRCGGRMYSDGEGGASCLWCGEYVYEEVKEKKVQHKQWPPQGRTW